MRVAGPGLHHHGHARLARGRRRHTRAVQSRGSLVVGQAQRRARLGEIPCNGNVTSLDEQLDTV